MFSLIVAERNRFSDAFDAEVNVVRRAVSDEATPLLYNLNSLSHASPTLCPSVVRLCPEPIDR